MQTDFMLYKLIVLYLLDKVDFHMNNSQIVDFILENNYTNYFIIQQTIAELVESGLISAKTVGNNSRYNITEEGIETLGFFESKISDAIKEDISKYIQQNEYAMREKNSAMAYYFRSDSTDFVVNLNIKENNINIIDLNVLVPTEDIAVKMCSNWQEKSPDIYSYIFKSLQ